MRRFAPLVLLLAIALIALPAFADTPAATLDDLFGLPLSNGPFTLGWQFTVSQTITVTALGAFDDSQNGLLQTHDVGIWDASGNLMGSATVGMLDPLTNQFRYHSASFVLGPGTYDIGAVWLDGTDPMVFPPATNFATAAGITYIQNDFIAGGVLTDPTNHTDPPAGYLGPNFLFTSSTSTPEPSSLLLLGSGLLAGVGMIRRKINL